MEKIAIFAGLSVRAVQKFFASLESKGCKKNYLSVKARFNQKGGNTTNEYKLNPNFKNAMNWLEKRHKLNTAKKNTKSIMLSMEKQQKVHPPLLKKFTPLSKDCPFRKDQTIERSVVCINPLVKLRGLDQYAQIFASKYASDYEILEALDSCRYQENRQILINPSSYFIGALKNKMRSLRKTC